MRAEKYLRYYKIYDHGIAIFIDSQSAIMSLTDVYNTSKLVHKWRTFTHERWRNIEISSKNTLINSVVFQLAHLKLGLMLQRYQTLQKFGSHVLRLGHQYNVYRRSCHNMNMEESTLHICFFVVLSEIANVEISSSFLSHCEWFT